MLLKNFLTRRTVVLLGLAAVAGIAAGGVAVYVNSQSAGNGAQVAAATCAGAPAAAAALEPVIKGEVAAFRTADAPDLMTDLAFRAPDGSETSLADFAGKTVLVNLWATWCGPCRAEMPSLDRLQAELGGDDFEVVAINIDTADAERARDFLDDIGVANLALYADPTTGVFNDLKRRGLALGLPVTLLVDDKGCRLGGVQGPAEWDSEDARSLIEAALGS